jgi:plastocyanin
METPNKPYSLTFPKPGTYHYYCLVHQPQMIGTVIVNPAGTPYPSSQDQYNQLGQIAMGQDLAAAQASLALFPFSIGGPTIAAGIAPGLSKSAPAFATVLRFLDGDTLSSSTVTISAGSSVTWVNESNNVPHTVTFFPAGATPPPDFDQNAPPSGGTTYGGTSTVNSGLLSPGQSFTLTFTARGTFTYYCLVHDDKGMIATVVVQ